MLETWRRDYNAERPHSSLGWLTPLAYAACLQSPSSLTGQDVPFSGGSASCPVASANESGLWMKLGEQVTARRAA